MVLEEQPEDKPEGEPIELVSMKIGDVAELSLNSVVGFTTLGTIKLRGQIRDHEVVVLFVVPPTMFKPKC